MREIDRLTTERYGVPSLELMENAATAVMRTIQQRVFPNCQRRRVLVFCGKGNNGGDGAAVARLLATSGAQVSVILIGKVQETKGDARVNFDRLGAWHKENSLREGRTNATPSLGTLEFFECDSDGGWQQLLQGVLSSEHDLVVDAIFGTGLTRAPEGLHKKAIQYISAVRNGRDKPPFRSPIVVAVDLPSGLDADRDEPIGQAVSADLTVTMTAPKRANVVSPAAAFNGELTVVPIGSPDELLADMVADLFVTEANDACRWLVQTRYAPDSYKNIHGHALIIAGSRGFTGAAVLCGNAAMRSGAGLVTVATPAWVQPLVATQVMPEVMTTSLAETDRGAVSDEAVTYALKLAEKSQVIAIGPGLSSEDDRTRNFVREAVKRRTAPVLIDADGLNCLAPWPKDLTGSVDFPIILTPHPGEMKRLLGDHNSEKDRVATARDFASSHGLILVLKGSRTLIASPDGRVIVNPTGNAGLGTAGAGDTLTGIIAGFLAQAYGTLKNEASAFDTVVAAVYVAGLAGDLAAKRLGMRTMVASDIRENLSQAICSLDPAGEFPHVAAYQDTRCL